MPTSHKLIPIEHFDSKPVFQSAVTFIAVLEYFSMWQPTAFS